MQQLYTIHNVLSIINLRRFYNRVDDAALNWCNFAAMSKQIAIVDLYKRKQWPRWIELLKDIEGFATSSFDEVAQSRRQLVKELQVQGAIVHELTLDIEDYIAWVGKQGLAQDRDHRRRFASLLHDRELATTGAYLLRPKKC